MHLAEKTMNQLKRMGTPFASKQIFIDYVFQSREQNCKQIILT